MKGTSRATAAPSAGEAEAGEFAALRRARTRHPALAVAAGVLALFLVFEMRADLAYFLSPREPADLGEARALVASDRGRHVLAEAVNRLVRVGGTPDRESALQVDTKGSWTFTQFFRILGTESRLYVHRLEDPLPAWRAERDVFEGRLVRFSDLSFEDAIRAHFSSHVSTTHFFRVPELLGVVRAGVVAPVTPRDLAGDAVTLGPNDILAIDLRHAGEVEVVLPASRFGDAEATRAALVARGARVLRPGRPEGDNRPWVISVTPEERDQLLDAIGRIDAQADIRDVHEIVKVRLADLVATPGATTLSARDAASGGSPTSPGRVLDGIVSIRTLATVQVPPDAYLIVEADTPRDHVFQVAIALVLLVFASVNLVGLARGLGS